MASRRLSDSRTRKSLLLRVRDVDNQEAWSEFVDHYAPKIFSWCRRFHLQESDALDVTQEVLIKLMDSMCSFVYNPNRGSFRGWLKTVTTNAIKDLGRSLKRQPIGSGSPSVEHLIRAIEDPAAMRALEEAIEHGYQAQLLQEAESRVALRVKRQTWQVYRLTSTNQRSAAAVASELDIPISEVYVAKSRVIKMLRETIALLKRC